MLRPFYENKYNSFSATASYSLTFRPHLHNLIEGIYVAEGEIEIRMEQESHLLKQGDMAIIFPNIVHSYHSEEQCHNFCEFFFYPLKTDSQLFHLLQGKRPSNPYLCSELVHKDIPEQFEEIVFLYGEKKPNELLMRALMELILIRSLGHLNLKNQQYSEAQNLTANAVTYFTENFKNEITLEETAKHFGVNKYYLSHILNASLGMSISSYISHLRIDYAKELLMSTNLSIAEISLSSGYENVRTFNRCFKKITGCSPKEFRHIPTM